MKDETIKASARHNATDRQLLKDALKKNAELQALLIDLGAEIEADAAEDAIEEAQGNTTTAVPVGAEVVTGKATDVIKSISLDEMISNVRDAFYKTFRTGMMYSDSTMDFPYVISVYPDFVVAKCGICYHKVGYTIGDLITFTPRDQWAEVEPDWVTKSLPNLDALLSSVKSVGEDRLGMYLVMFGNEKVRDLGKEFFTPKTQDMLNVFKAIGKIPAFYHHGLDKNVKAEVVGMYDVMVQDDVGIWAEMQLDKASKYKDAMLMLTEKGALGSSSGCLPTSRQVNKTSGEIERWAIIEGSLTPTPMDYRQRLDTPVEVLKSVYKSCGLEFPEDEPQGEAPGDVESQALAETQKSVELELQAMQLAFHRLQLEVM